MFSIVSKIGMYALLHIFLQSPQERNISSYLEVIRRTMDIHSFNYDNFIFFGNFNADVSDKAMPGYCKSYKLKNLQNNQPALKNLKIHHVLTCF